MSNRKLNFKSIGNNVKIHPLAKIISPENITLASNIQIDDFTLIMGGDNMEIGNYCHIASFTSITGGGEFIMEDFAGISPGCRLLVGTDDYSGSYLIGPTIPNKYRNIERTFITLKKYSVIGANVVVMPGVTIGEGAAIGAYSLVTKDVEPWTINIGIPSRPIGKRRNDRLPELAKHLPTI